MAKQLAPVSFDQRILPTVKIYTKKEKYPSVKSSSHAHIHAV